VPRDRRSGSATDTGRRRRLQYRQELRRRSPPHRLRSCPRLLPQGWHLRSPAHRPCPAPSSRRRVIESTRRRRSPGAPRCRRFPLLACRPLVGQQPLLLLKQSHHVARVPAAPPRGHGGACPCPVRGWRSTAHGCAHSTLAYRRSRQREALAVASAVPVAPRGNDHRHTSLRVPPRVGAGARPLDEEDHLATDLADGRFGNTAQRAAVVRAVDNNLPGRPQALGSCNRRGPNCASWLGRKRYCPRTRERSAAQWPQTVRASAEDGTIQAQLADNSFACL
jgi:hypothetical protein